MDPYAKALDYTSDTVCSHRPVYSWHGHSRYYSGPARSTYGRCILVQAVCAGARETVIRNKPQFQFFEETHMGNSLFDQLKKSGLVDEKKAKQATKDKRKQDKQKRGKKAQPLDESKLRAQQAQAEKTAHDRELNQQRLLEAEKKAIAAQIKQLIQMNHIEASDGEIGFNFTDDNKVQRIFVSEKLQSQLASGRLAIVRLDSGYALVPAAVADKIKQRDLACVILSNVQQPEESDVDDPYADYQVPDDLMW